MIQEAVVRAVASILEGDEAGQCPFVGAICELPLGAPVALALPVDEPLSECSGEVDPEAGGEVAPFVDKAELPASGDEIGEQVVSVIRPKLDPAAADHLRADCFHVLQFVQLQLRVQQDARKLAAGLDVAPARAPSSNVFGPELGKERTLAAGVLRTWHSRGPGLPR